MIVRKLEEIIGTDRDVFWGNGQSRRFLIESDGLGYSITETVVNAGSSSYLEYKNHLESCYCIEGEGEVETVSDGVIHPIQPGTIYALNHNDQHILRAHTTMRLVCVFTPALVGHESHALSDNQSSCY